jgi:hypothetical protein
VESAAARSIVGGFPWGGVCKTNASDVFRATRGRTKRSIVIILAGALALAFLSVASTPMTLALVGQSPKAAVLSSQPKAASTATTGNGAPSGAHYDLNIHGVAKGGSASTGSSGHDIFVPLQGKCAIMLSPGAFQVLDPNCLDGSAAFQLPNPVASTTTTTITTVYSVWVRALAKPGGSSSMTTCATDPTTGSLVCSTSAFVSVQTRSSGKSVFRNVTGDLLFISQCINGTLTRTPLFDASLQNFFWSYDNNGLRLLQLRFYQLPTTVPATGTTC